MVHILAAPVRRANGGAPANALDSAVMVKKRVLTPRTR